MEENKLTHYKIYDKEGNFLEEGAYTQADIYHKVLHEDIQAIQQ